MSLGDFCRLCGTLCTSKRVKIFHIMPETLRLKILKIIPFNLSIDDKLPKDLCYKCIDTLKEFTAFIDKSWTIQKTFCRRATLDQSEHAEETVNLPYPKNWYEDDSETVKNIPKETHETTSENKETDSSKSEAETAASRDGYIDSESKKSENSSENESSESKDGAKSPELADSKSVDEQDTSPRSLDEFQRDADDIIKNAITKEAEADSDDNISRTSSVSGLSSQEKEKRKMKFKKKNPFCAPSKKRGKGRRVEVGRPKMENGHRRKRPTEAEKLAAENIQHYGDTPTSASTQLLQLFVNGELTTVERSSNFKNSAFIISCIPNFGFVYACTKCDAFYTSETAALVHECNISFNTAASIPSVELIGKASQYMCHFCDQSFPRRVALESHLSSHLTSDVSEDDAPIKMKRRRVSSSDLDNLSSGEAWNRPKSRRKRPKMLGSETEKSESEYDYSESTSAGESDNFIVDDDYVEYEDDFIVQDEEAINRRRLKAKKKKKKRKHSGSRSKKYLF